MSVESQIEIDVRRVSSVRVEIRYRLGEAEVEAAVEFPIEHPDEMQSVARAAFASAEQQLVQKER